MQVEILGMFNLQGRLCRNFGQKVSCPKSSLVKEDIVLRSEPGVGAMPGSPQGSSRIPGNSGRVLSNFIDVMRQKGVERTTFLCECKLPLSSFGTKSRRPDPPRLPRRRLDPPSQPRTAQAA
ncbi:unnamed protein product [Prunus armeniaca]